MPTSLPILPALYAWLPCVPPAVFLLAALATRARRLDPWRIARAATTTALVTAALALLLEVLRAQHVLHGQVPMLHGQLEAGCTAGLQAGGITLLDCGTRLGVGTALVLLLVCFLGWVITRFSGTYLDGDAHPHRFVARLTCTLLGASVVVATNNLFVLALAWFTTSVALHGLLTWYPQRIPALTAAHKKFIASGIADASMFAAVALLAHAYGTLAIDELAARAATEGLTTGAHAAVVLVAVAALLKCAQLPAHGWLIQVMEAPTPVSALLHAGVVNLGGVVLIRLAALLAEAPAAQALLVLVGLATAVLASLVMLTRISVKVMLAWSTCAQMGFMLVQCGLGAYELALLHLLAHSLYKAHAFLSAGTVVEATRAAHFLAPTHAGLRARLTAVAASTLIVATAAAAWAIVVPVFMMGPSLSPVLLAFTWIVALATAPLLAGMPGSGLAPRARAAATVLGIAFAYLALHAAIAHAVPTPPHHGPLQPLLLGVVVASFTALTILQCLLLAAPDAPLARRLRPWFYAGLHLDELFTRATFRLWPVPAHAGTPTPLAHAES